MSAISGLYVITPEIASLRELLEKVELSLRGGARAIQYRNKSGAEGLIRSQLHALVKLCRQFSVPLIVNDSVELAAEFAAGVHLGATDSSIAVARHALGHQALIGRSCYNRLDLAIQAQSDGADYVAFGSFYPSPTKPDAIKATPDLLRAAKSHLRIPVVAIGGITPAGAAPLIAAGADAVAVISALFGATEIAATAREFTGLFGKPVAEQSDGLLARQQAT
jgi:thiamine-phosphate pyrophosphorylase